MKNRQPLYWLVILFSFPLLGSAVYFFMVYMPNSKLERSAMKTISGVAKALDPMKEVRLARADFEHTPTAQNQMRLAYALLEVGQPQEAAQLYESALKGPFASDPELRFGAARAFVESERYAEALSHLSTLRTHRDDYRPQALALLWAKCHAGLSHHEQARQAFEQAVARFASFEAYAEYAIWAITIGDTITSARLQTDIDKITSRWTPTARELNKPFTQRLKMAYEQARQRKA